MPCPEEQSPVLGPHYSTSETDMKVYDSKSTKKSRNNAKSSRRERPLQNDVKRYTKPHGLDEQVIHVVRQAGTEPSPGPSRLAQSPSQSCAAQPPLSAYQSIPVWLPGPPQLAGAVASDLPAACPREGQRGLAESLGPQLGQATSLAGTKF